MTDTERGPAHRMDASAPEPGAQRVMGDGRQGDACAGRIQACLTSLGYAVSFGDARACARAAATADPVDRAERLQAFLAHQTPPIVLTDGQALWAVRVVEG